MRILIISAVFPPEPVVSASISFDLAEELSKDNDVTVLCPRPTRPLGYKLKTYEPSGKFKRVVLNSYTCPESTIVGRFRESYSFGKHCAHYIKTDHTGIDVIYFNAWPIFSQFIIAHTANKYHIPYIVHVQDIYPETILNSGKFLLKLPFNFFLRADKYVLRSARSIVTISEQMRRYVQKTRKIEGKINVVYNWQDQPIRQLVDLQDKVASKFVFMFLGSLSPTAAIDNLISGFSKANIPGTQLVLAGAGSDKARLEKLAAMHPESDIHFIEAPKDQVHNLQQIANVLLLSLKQGSAAYALPSKLTSYLFSQKPVIGCVDKGSAVGDIISRAGCGWICEVSDPSGIAATFVSAKKTSEQTRNEMGRKGRVFAEQHLSRAVNLSQLKKIIVSA